MPYRLKKQGGKFCVENSATGESKGCSDSRKMAVAHMRALYANEGEKSKGEIEELVVKAIADYQIDTGELVPPEEITADEKDYYGDSTEYPYVPWGVTSYEGYDSFRKTRDVERAVRQDIAMYPQLASNIMGSSEVSDKASALETLGQELADRVRESVDNQEEDEKAAEKPSEPESKIDLVAPPETKKGVKELAEELIGHLKSLVGIKPEIDKSADLMLWKDKSGRMMWFARYSNNIIDDDNPPDIISEKSHRRFVEQVEKGAYPYPELWIWHEKSWKIGQGVWCAYDDSGFAEAAGYIFPECEPIAEKLSQLKSRGTSHGMPLASIVRDPEDPRVIIEHQTKEISLLPTWGAANKLTSFDIFKGEDVEDKMALPKEKKAELIEKWGIPQDILTKIEDINAKAAAKAADAGLESKDAPVATPPAETPETKETPATIPAAEKPVETPAPDATKPEATDPNDDHPTRKEVAEVLAPYCEAVVAIQKSIEDLAAKIDEVSKEKTLRDHLFTHSPAAALLGQFASQRAVGSEAAEVKEADDAKLKGPKQTETPVERRTGIQMIDAMLATPSKQ